MTYRYPLYRSMKDIEAATQRAQLALEIERYWADPKRITSCPIEDSPWKFDFDFGMMINSQTGAAFVPNSIPSMARKIAGQRAKFTKTLAEETAKLPEKALEAPLREPKVFRQTSHERNAGPAPSRRAQRFSPSMMKRELDPLLALTKEQRDEKINRYRHAAKIMCGEADWDEALEIAGPKIIDQLLYMCERLVWGVQEKQRETAAQINALNRQTMGDEIPLQQLERLEMRQASLRVQERHFQMMSYAFQIERDPIVRASGLDWQAYEGIKQRSERSAKAWRSKVRRRSSLSQVIENMSDEEYRRWVDNTQRYEPKFDGVAVSDDEASPGPDVEWEE